MGLSDNSSFLWFVSQTLGLTYGSAIVLEAIEKHEIEAENAKVVLRTVRKEANEELKKLQKNGTPEDEIKSSETLVQTLTDGYVVKCDKHLEVKEKEIMTV